MSQLQWQNVAAPNFTASQDDTGRATALLQQSLAGFGDALQKFSDRGVQQELLKYTDPEELKAAMASGALDMTNASSDMMAKAYARQQSLLQDAIQREAYNQSQLMNPKLLDAQDYINRGAAVGAEVAEKTKQYMVEAARLNNALTEAQAAQANSVARQHEANTYRIENTNKGEIAATNARNEGVVAASQDALGTRKYTDLFTQAVAQGKITNAAEGHQWITSQANPRLALAALKQSDPTLANQITASLSLADLQGNPYGDGNYGSEGAPAFQGSSDLVVLGGRLHKDALTEGYRGIKYNAPNGTLGEFVDDAPRVVSLTKPYMDEESKKAGLGSSASGPFQIMLVKHKDKFATVFGPNWRDVQWTDYKNQEKFASYLANEATKGKTDAAAGAALKSTWLGLKKDFRSNEELGRLYRSNPDTFWQLTMKYESPRPWRMAPAEELVRAEAQQQSRNAQNQAATIPIDSTEHPSTKVYQQLTTRRDLLAAESPTDALQLSVTRAEKLRPTITTPAAALEYIEDTISPIAGKSANPGEKRTISEDAKEAYEYVRRNIDPSLQNDHALIAAIAGQLTPKMGWVNDVKSWASGGHWGYQTDIDALKEAIGEVDPKLIPARLLETKAKATRLERMGTALNQFKAAQDNIRKLESVYQKTGARSDLQRLSQAKNEYYTLGVAAQQYLQK